MWNPCIGRCKKKLKKFIIQIECFKPKQRFSIAIFSIWIETCFDQHLLHSLYFSWHVRNLTTLISNDLILSIYDMMGLILTIFLWFVYKSNWKKFCLILPKNFRLILEYIRYKIGHEKKLDFQMNLVKFNYWTALIPFWYILNAILDIQMSVRHNFEWCCDDI